MDEFAKAALVKCARGGAICLLPCGAGQYLLQREANGDLRPPGGGFEEGDRNRTNTIVRELGEEFGLSEARVKKRLKLLGYEPRRKYFGTPLFRLEGHGLEPGTYQASNDPAEMVTLVRARLSHPRYTGPAIEDLIPPSEFRKTEKDPAKLASSHGAGLPSKIPEGRNPDPDPAVESREQRRPARATGRRCRACGHRLPAGEEECAVCDEPAGPEDMAKRAAASPEIIRRPAPISTAELNAPAPEPDQSPEPAGTGPESIAAALDRLNLDEMEETARHTIRHGAKSKRADAVKILGLVNGFKRSGLHPRDLMIKRVPVIPPIFRPFTQAGDAFVPGDANELYRDLINLKEVHKKIEQEAGPAVASKNRLNVYDAVKALYGFGEPTSPKTRERGVSGFLQTLTGSSPKFSFVQRNLLSKNVDFVARGVMGVDPDLGLDEISVPDEMLWKMYAPYIQRRLVRRGVKPGDAVGMIKDRHAMAGRALDEEIGERPVMYSRAPAWHKFNIIGGWPKRISGHAVKINMFVGTGMSGDHDGNCCVGGTKIILALPNEMRANDGMRLMANATAPAGLQNKTLVELKIRDMPHEPDGRPDKNGAMVYRVPPGIEVWTAAADGRGARMSPVESFTVEQGCRLVKVSTNRKMEVICSDNESLVTFCPENGFKKIKPEEAVGLPVPFLKRVPRIGVKTGREHTPGGRGLDLVPIHKSLFQILEKEEEAQVVKKTGWTKSAYASAKHKANVAACPCFYRSTAAALLRSFPEKKKKSAIWRAHHIIATDPSIVWQSVKSAQEVPTETVYDLGVPETKFFALASGWLINDTLNIHVPGLADAVSDVREKLMPSKMLFSIKDPEKVVPAPKHEAILGLRTAQTRPARNRHVFSTEAEALQSIRAGAVRMSDEVEINQQKENEHKDYQKEQPGSVV